MTDDRSSSISIARSNIRGGIRRRFVALGIALGAGTLATFRSPGMLGASLAAVIVLSLGLGRGLLFLRALDACSGWERDRISLTVTGKHWGTRATAVLQTDPHTTEWFARKPFLDGQRQSVTTDCLVGTPDTKSSRVAVSIGGHSTWLLTKQTGAF